MAAACERWLWQQGGKDANKGGGAQALIFMGYGAKQQAAEAMAQPGWMLWRANIPSARVWGPVFPGLQPLEVALLQLLSLHWFRPASALLLVF